MGWFLVCTSSKILNNIAIWNLILNIQFNLEYIYTHKTWKVEEITHDINHDLIFYCIYNPLWLPEDEVMFKVLGIYNFAHSATFH